MKWLCKIFGHRYDWVDLVMADIKLNSINRRNDISIRCKRCSHEDRKVEE